MGTFYAVRFIDNDSWRIHCDWLLLAGQSWPLQFPPHLLCFLQHRGQKCLLPYQYLLNTLKLWDIIRLLEYSKHGAANVAEVSLHASEEIITASYRPVEVPKYSCELSGSEETFQNDVLLSSFPQFRQDGPNRYHEYNLHW